MNGCSNITSINSKFLLNIFNSEFTEFNGVFKNCISLTEIPEKFNIPYSVSSFVETFYNCTSLTNMNNLNIPLNTKTIEKMFYNCISLADISPFFIFPENIENLNCCFYNCSSLIEIPNNIWPTNGFVIENEINPINIVSAFANCKNLTGSVPKYKLWMSETVWSPISLQNTFLPMTFANCTRLSNYSDIPNYWGGNPNKTTDDFNSFDFEIEILEDDLMFSLPIHKTYNVYNFETNIFETLSSAHYNFLINWGDEHSNIVQANRR